MSEKNSVGSGFGNDTISSRVIEWPAERLEREPQIYCAFNPVRERFLCSHIELVDLEPEYLQQRLSTLTPGSKSALWLAPFRGIFPNQVSSPIDIVFLDRNNCVLDLLESFPASQATVANWPVGSAIALPARSIASSGTLAGDQLILCSPRKMKRRLHDLEAPVNRALDREIFSHNLNNIPHEIPLAFKTTVQVANWTDILDQARSSKHPSVEPAPAAAPSKRSAEPAAEPSESPQEIANPKRNWLFCLLAPHRREKRTFLRESLPWVAAYFFNGSAPAPATIRNITVNGMYVVTRERWNPGTIIRVTLSDWRLPSTDRTITVNAMAVRWGDDGVGLRFIFQKPRRSAPDNVDEPLVDVTRQELKEFLHSSKNGARLLTWRNRLFRSHGITH